MAQSPLTKIVCRIVYKLYENFIVPNEHLQSIFEEKSIFWVNDLEQVSALVVRTISDFKKDVEFGGALQPCIRMKRKTRSLSWTS